MITFETTELVFDIATLLSIIGSAAAFILITRRENKKNLQNEKVAEIWKLLVEFRTKHLDVFSKEINNDDDKVADPGPLLTDLAEFLRVEMLPTFAIFATKENIYALKKMMDATEKAIDAWDDFDDIADKNKKAYKTVDEAMGKYYDSMRKLDVQLIENLRNQVHNESKNKSKEIAELYKKRKYNYRVAKFK